MALLEAFRKYIADNDLATHDDRILLTVSGGVDSMVMLSLFTRSGYRVGVAHCNFQLRGAESDEDEVLVEEEARKYGVEFYNKRFETAAEMERTGESMEMAARRLRYAWFDALSREHGYTVVAIAHHADDSIETFFINLLRGTGLRGLTGISTQVGKVVRPLMFASRKEILEYAVANRIPFREDSSNRSTKYLRNKIRLGLIPPHPGDQPQVHESHAPQHRTADRRPTLHQPRHRTHTRRSGDHRERTGHDTPRPHRPGVPAGVRHLRAAQLGLRIQGRRHRLALPFAQARHDGPPLLLARAGRLRGPRHDRRGPDRPRRRMSGDRRTGVPRSYCGNSALYFEYCDIDAIKNFGVPEHIAQVDADLLKFPLTLRRWREGDWFIPFGMAGRKKVSDFLIDAKVSMPEKERQFVLLSGDEIVWLVGRRIDDRYRLTPDTENVLRITKEIV